LCLAAFLGCSSCVTGALAAPFTTHAALKLAVDNCLAAVPSGEKCCSEGGADCGPAGLADMPNWDVSQVTDMSGLFQNKMSFNQDIGDWDVSKVTDMTFMFRFAKEFNQDISRWKVSSVTSTWYMFNYAESFEQDITSWTLGSGAVVGYMFAGATNWTAAFVNCGLDDSDAASCSGVATYDLVANPKAYRSGRGGTSQNFFYDDGPSDAWAPYKQTACAGSAPFPSYGSLAAAVARCLAAVPSGEKCCSSGAAGCGPACYSDIPDWDVSQVTNMGYLFIDRAEFNQDISRWDVSKVTDMVDMFNGARDFNQPIGNWDVSKVENMRAMFSGSTGGSPAAKAFNQDISRWDVSSVKDMTGMFLNHRVFSQDITGWKTKADVDASQMFGNAGGWLAAFHNCAYDSTPAVCDGTYPTTSSPWPGQELRPDDGPPSAWERIGCSLASHPIESGTWTYNGATCKRSVKIDDTQFRDYEGLLLGSTCEPYCYIGGYAVSSATECSANGELTSISTCDAMCKSMTTPSNGKRGGCPHEGNQSSWLKQGESCQPACDAGFEPTGRATCEAGPSNFSFVLCLNATGPACDASAAPEHGSVGTCTSSLASGKICQPVCNEGYRVSGFSYCSGGEFTAANCTEKPCDEGITVSHGGPGDCPLSLPGGSTCQPTCYPGFTVSGPHSCSLGVLTRATCDPNPCNIPGIPANGKAGNCTGAMESGSKCQFACDEGFILTGPTSCFAGTLTLGTCIRGTYPPPPADTQDEDTYPPPQPPAPPPPLIQDTQDEDGADRLGIIIASAVSLLLIL